jgi:hypothetical protein
MIIIGVRFFTWGSAMTDRAMHCGQCGTIAPFVLKRGMRFITVFFVIPVIPISGVKHIVQCPGCRTRYQAAALQTQAL